MHHAVKAWCIVSTSGRFATKAPDFYTKSGAFLTFCPKMFFVVKQHFWEKVPESCMADALDDFFENRQDCDIF